MPIITSLLDTDLGATYIDDFKRLLKMFEGS